jgi:curved DNA-binding protein CbpA
MRKRLGQIQMDPLPEFQTFADKRMKEINAAYELLKAREISA